MDDPRMPKIDVDWGAFFDTVNKGGPVAIAIVGSTVLSELLGRIIMLKAATKEAGENITSGRDGPACTFYQRSELAYALGIINDVEYSNIKIIRNIRNKYAHDMPLNKFNEKYILGKCNELIIPWEGGQFVEAVAGYERLKLVMVSLSQMLALRPSLCGRMKTVERELAIEKKIVTMYKALVQRGKF